MSVVELQKLSKQYGDFTAVNNIDLVVEAGEFVTLLGPSGCGKTTTLRMVAGFVRPSGGRISIGDNDVTTTPPHLRLVGFVFQNYALFPHMTVAQNIEFGLRMHKVPAAERRQRVAEALDLVRLEQLAGRYPRQLSGGQQQRVALARALVIRPAVLLLDEPFGALDKQLRDHMRVELRALQQQLGISTVFVTHDQEEALAMSDRICVMAEGVIQQIGAPDTIYEQPCNRFVAEFMGRSNLLAARVKAGENDQQIIVIDTAGLQLRARQHGFDKDMAVVAMIRPERIRLQKAGSDPAATSGTVTGSVYLGAIRHYEVALGNDNGPTLQVMRQNADAADGLAPGSAVDVIIPDDAVYLIKEKQNRS